MVTGEPVEQKFYAADVKVQLVDMMLAEVPYLQVPVNKSNHKKVYQITAT